MKKNQSFYYCHMSFTSIYYVDIISTNVNLATVYDPSEQITNCDVAFTLYGRHGRPVDVVGTNCAHWVALKIHIS